MKRAFTIVELLMGLVLIGGVLSASVYIFRPVATATKRHRLTLKAHRLENEIRRGTYYVANFQNTAGFTIELAGVVLARAGTSTYVTEDLDQSSNIPNIDYAFETKIELYQAGADNRIIYRISAKDPQLNIPPLGVREWPTDIGAYMNTNINTDHSLVKVSSDLAAAVSKSCNSGIMRGILKTPNGAYSQVCWEYQGVSPDPIWAIPTAMTIDDLSNKISINYTDLNLPTCPAMSITTLDNRKWNLVSFFAFKKIELTDIFPPKLAGQAMASLCERVIDFEKYSSDGNIPQSIVNDVSLNKKPGKCPDVNLYKLNSNGTCSLNFNLNAVPLSTPATAGGLDL